MEVEELFLTVEQSRHLQESGLDMSDAAFCWVLYTDKDHYSLSKNISHMNNGILESNGVKETIPTYTLQEAIDKLPEEIDERYLTFGKEKIVYMSRYGAGSDDFTENNGENLLEVTYNMLEWVLKYNYLKQKK